MVRYYLKIFRTYGFRAIIFLLRSKFLKDKMRGIKLFGVKHPIELSNFNVDVTTLFQIFFNKEYQIKELKSAKFIIDCGANIGLSAIYFANVYPRATIIAIEPDPKNFEVLKQNTVNYENIKCLELAIWPTLTELALFDPGIGSWGYQTKPAIEGGVKTITIDQIMKQYKVHQIDLLKIDVEGAEEELFSQNYTNWLDKTNAIAIELHEFLKPGVSKNFYEAISHYNFKMYGNGENLICIRGK